MVRGNQLPNIWRSVYLNQNIATSLKRVSDAATAAGGKGKSGWIETERRGNHGLNLLRFTEMNKGISVVNLVDGILHILSNGNG